MPHQFTIGPYIIVAVPILCLLLLGNEFATEVQLKGLLSDLSCMLLY